MDSRRLQELRDVYTQLWQQSTGGLDVRDTQAAAAAATIAGDAAAPRPSLPPPPPPQPGGGLSRSSYESTAAAAGHRRGSASFLEKAERMPAADVPKAVGEGGGSNNSAASPLGGATTSRTAALSREASFVSNASDHEGGGGGSGAGTGKRKRKRSERKSFYPDSYFEWTDELMAKELPERSNGSFVASIFELGLKHSSPKVLMKLMPPKADQLTTEHIKSRLQKYRLHAHRSKEEFLEFYNLRLQAKFAEFLLKEGWRNLPPDHGSQGHYDESGYDSAGGGDGAGGEGEGGGGAAGGSEGAAGPRVKVSGQMVGDIRDLGAQCIREQFHLQEVLRQHISAQLKLQTEIHEHLTTATAASDNNATPSQRSNGVVAEGVPGGKKQQKG